MDVLAKTGLECTLRGLLPVPDMQLAFWGGGPFGELPLQLRLGSVLSWASVQSYVHSTPEEAVRCDVWGSLQTCDLESAGRAQILVLHLLLGDTGNVLSPGTWLPCG